jgi:putative ABC transport system substrate-binding protein
VPRGALFALEANLYDIEVRTAAIIAKVLAGTRPAEIPVEEPATFELWINMKTANALGLKVPSSVRVQATRVFD